MPDSSVADARLVIFDLDGVVYRGGRPVPGAAHLIAGLRDAGRLVRFATNNSTATRQTYVERLAGMEIPATVNEIVTSTSATIDHLAAHLPHVRRILAVGASGMVDELTAAGYRVTAATDAAPSPWRGTPLPERYDAVIAGLDPQFDYRRLAAASAAIRDGARFIATNADMRFPTPEGFLPGAGSIVAAIGAASGVEPLVIGKPSPAMFAAILEQAGVSPAQALVIGDNPDADVVGARRAGIPVMLTLTGVVDGDTAAALDGERRPDWIARDPGEAGRLLGLAVSS